MTTALSRSIAAPTAGSAVDADLEDGVDQAVGRLTDEFRFRLQPQVIGSVVRGCRRDLSGVPATALPELVERLARERLQATAG